MLRFDDGQRTRLRLWVRRYWVPAAVAGFVMFCTDLLRRLGPEVSEPGLISGQILTVVMGMAFIAMWLAVSTVDMEEREAQSGIHSLSRARRRRQQELLRETDYSTPPYSTR